MSSKSSEAPFKVGDEIVAIKNHNQGDYKIGDKFIVNDIKFGCCNWVVDIGRTSSSLFVNCARCKMRFTDNWKVFYHYDNFTKLQQPKEHPAEVSEITQELLSLIPVVEEVSDKPVKEKA